MEGTAVPLPGQREDAACWRAVKQTGVVAACIQTRRLAEAVQCALRTGRPCPWVVRESLSESTMASGSDRSLKEGGALK